MRGGIHAAGPMVLLLASCGGPDALAIKTTPLPISAVAMPVPARIAEGRGLLATGNVGLALEAFRKAHRDDPSSASALAGLAACYERMGRFELSHRYYEQALANAPTDRAILAALARSMEMQGRTEEAQVIRRELAGSEPAATPVAPPTPGQSERRSIEQAATGSITVTLPPAMKGGDDLAPLAAQSTATTLQPIVAGPVDDSPRLERLSLGEVALVTTAQPRWRPQLVRRTNASTTVRFVPLKPARRDHGVRLLNAARYQGLAARTRLTLRRNGWERVSIGDAGRIRQKSLVLYSPATAAAARRLAAQFGFGIAKDARPGPLTVLLGRDAIARQHKTS